MLHIFFRKGGKSFAASLAQFFEWKLGSEITTNDTFSDSFFFVHPMIQL